MKTFREHFLNEVSNVDMVMSELKRIFPKKNFSVRVATDKEMEIDFDDNHDAIKFTNQAELEQHKQMKVEHGAEKTVKIKF